jgi:hypothetical protein
MIWRGEDSGAPVCFTATEPYHWILNLDANRAAILMDYQRGLPRRLPARTAAPVSGFRLHAAHSLNSART